MTDWSACGSVMDYLRTCYRSQMALDPTQPDVRVWGRWRRCRPGAKVVPYPHAFGSSRMVDIDVREARALGERAAGPYFKGGTESALPGDRVCGDALAWAGVTGRYGSPLPVDQWGRPACCGAAPPAAGVSLDGTAAQVSVLPAAGVSLDGTAAQALDGTLSAGGGVSLDGTAAQALGSTLSAGGGVSLDGTAAQELIEAGHDFCGLSGLPSTLYAHFSGAGCLDGQTWALSKHPTFAQWFITNAPTPCGGGTATITLNMICISGAVWLSSSCGGNGAFTAMSAGGPPYVATGSVTYTAGACAGTWSVTINTVP